MALDPWGCAMLRSKFHSFLADEGGAGTIWALMWLVLLFGIGGLAVDVTDVFRAKTMLQATADAAALAGTIELPRKQSENIQQSIVASVNMAYKNMHLGDYGTVLMPGEVAVGDWDAVNKRIKPWEGKFPTAVMVTTRRDEINENEVGLNFLRILGAVGIEFNHWNVYAQAAAEWFVPECLTHSGMIARGPVDYQSKNKFSGEFCIHSEEYVKVSNDNQYGGLVTVSVNPKGDLIFGSQTAEEAPEKFSTNTYPTVIDPDTGAPMTLDKMYAEMYLDPKMVDQVDELIATFLDPSLDDEDQMTDIIPEYLRTDALGGDITPVIVEVAKKDFNVSGKTNVGVKNGWQYKAPAFANAGALPHQRKIYHITTGCEDGASGNNTITIGDNAATAANPLILTHIAIVTNCKIDFTGNVWLADVALLSSYTDGNLDHVNINFAGDDILGLPDACADGGGLFIVSTQSVKSPSSGGGLTLHGVQIVAAGDIEIAAKPQGINGIHFQAGGNISVTSQSDLGGFGCQGGFRPLITANYFRLVY